MLLARLRISLVATLLLTPMTLNVAAAQTLPTGGYILNRAASLVGFTIYASSLFKLKREGRFNDFTGELSYDPNNPGAMHVDLTVYTASVDIDDPDHNRLLRSMDFFDVERFPTMHFVSSAAEINTDGTFTVTGDLTIRDTTKRIAIPVKLLRSTSRSGATVPVFDTTFQIDRTEFGLNGAPTWGGFRVSIAKNVQIHIAVAIANGPLGLTR